MDGSTDYGRNHYLSVVLQILEDDHRVATHFYGLVQLGTSTDAESQKEALLKRFRDDYSLTAIKDKTVALVVDGESKKTKRDLQSSQTTATKY